MFINIYCCERNDCYGQEFQPYKFAGKQYIYFGNMECPDFGARMYDQLIGRWMCPDPLAEKYMRIV